MKRIDKFISDSRELKKIIENLGSARPLGMMTSFTLLVDSARTAAAQCTCDAWNDEVFTSASEE